MFSHRQVLSCLPYMKKRKMRMGFFMSPTAERMHSGIRSSCSLLLSLQLFLLPHHISYFGTVVITSRAIVSLFCVIKETLPVFITCGYINVYKLQEPF
uniref:Autophagy-related protein n=1 Tax=Rhizophora mucronata TaxID=61149 RepID=A0A2P2KBE2_RHIMU